jgi:circadian clock protein KaiC
VVTLLTVAQQGILGASMTSPVDLTYLADSVLLLRYFEQGGEILKAVSVLKKRVGKHETTIRQFETSSRGIEIGEALRDFQGVLTGTPVYKGESSAILSKR